MMPRTAFFGLLIATIKLITKTMKPGRADWEAGSMLALLLIIGLIPQAATGNAKQVAPAAVQAASVPSPSPAKLQMPTQLRCGR